MEPECLNCIHKSLSPDPDSLKSILIYFTVYFIKHKKIQDTFMLLETEDTINTRYHSCTVGTLGSHCLLGKELQWYVKHDERNLTFCCLIVI
jgi:hypothetical protein